MGQIGDQFHLGRLQLAPQGADPALVGGELVALHGAIEQVPDRLHHRIGHADVHVGSGATEFQGE